MDGCVTELEEVLKMFPPPPSPAMPANFRPGSTSSTVVPTPNPSGMKISLDSRRFQ